MRLKIALLCLVVAGCAGGGVHRRTAQANTTTTPSETRETRVAGTWENQHPAAMSTESVGGKNVLFGRSDSVWRGDLDGTTTWVERVHADAKHPGGFIGDADETFVGTVRNRGEGTLLWHDVFVYSPTGEVEITSTITRSRGSLIGTSGTVRFTGTATADGRGTGSYSGVLHSRH